MRSYVIKKIQSTPDWSTIPVMPIDNQPWGEPVDISAQAQICWDEEALYIRQEAAEKHIRREESGPMCRVCNDSCLEFFIRPTERMDFLNFEINPNRAVFLGYGNGKDTLLRIQFHSRRDTVMQEKLDIQTQITQSGWVLTYKIPFTLIRRFFPEFQPEAGLRVYGNAYKCGDLTARPHYIAWNPIDRPEPAFHCPDQFGCLIFGE